MNNLDHTFDQERMPSSMSFTLKLDRQAPIWSVLAIFFFLISNGHKAQDGALDLGFNIGGGANEYVRDVELLPDGKIIIVGGFTTFGSSTRNRIARLTSSGGLDATFNPTSGSNGDISASAMQPDGKILIGGYFTSYNGTPRRRLARLNANGSLDNTFDPGLGVGSQFEGAVACIEVRADGKIFVGGDFTQFNGQPRNRMVVLDPDGSEYDGVDLGSGMSSSVLDFAFLPDGRLIVVGDFVNYDGDPVGRIVRLNMDGTRDTGFGMGQIGATASIFTVGIQADGKVLAGGEFNTFNGEQHAKLIRLNEDGSVDDTFDIGSGPNDHVTGLLQQADGKIIVVGRFTTFNGEPHNRICRLNADGSLDPTFDAGTGFTDPNPAPYELVVQPNGKVLVGGNFFTYNGSTRRGILRLNMDASVSIDEEGLPEPMQIFPNPVIGTLSLRIDGLSGEDILLTVLDMQGRQILSSALLMSSSAEVHGIDLSSLSAGVYTLQISSGRGMEAVRIFKE
jgi:uncharacterized delta-60 repeat protein